MRTLYLFICLSLCSVCAFPQSIDPAFYLLDDPDQTLQTDYSGSAPIRVHFTAQPEGFDNPSDVFFKWQMYTEGSQEPYDVKQGNGLSEFEYTFSTSGQHRIVVTYNEYDDVAVTLTITAQESRLEFPNAFSPNGDGINDTYRAKPNSQSIVEFSAAIFNRWGQMLFRFRDINDEWDGTYKGKPVKDGVYFLNCEAKGADGRTYHIRKDVNILRGFNEHDIAH